MQLTLGALRENYSVNGKEIAKAVGISYQTLLKYERDSSNIPINLLNKFSHMYGVKADDIF